MILTYKIKHNSNFKIELQKARTVAEFALETKSTSSASVKHIGLKSCIACQILRKYANNKKIKKINSVLLAVPGQATKQKGGKLWIACLKLNLDISHLPKFSKINQVELNDEYAFISVTVAEQPEQKSVDYLGVDRNATGHVVVASLLNSGKVLKLGKQALHLRKKYQGIRRHLQKTGQFKTLKSISNKEQRILRDLDHKMSKAIVDFSVKHKSVIVLEQLFGLSKGTNKKNKFNKPAKRIVNNWSFLGLNNLFYIRPNWLELRLCLWIPVSHHKYVFAARRSEAG